MPIHREIAYWVILIAAYYGVTNFLGAEFMANISQSMFGPFIDVWKNHRLGQFIPSITHPIVIIIIVAACFMAGKNGLRISRQICGLVVALLIFRVVFLLLGSADAVAPSGRFVMIGLACLAWLFISALFDEENSGGALRNLWRRIKS